MITALARLFGLFLILATVISFVLAQIPLFTGFLGEDLTSVINTMASSIWWLLPVGGFLYKFGSAPLEKAGLVTIVAIIILYVIFNTGVVM